MLTARQRAAESAALAAVLDNARGFERLAQACDPTRPAQAERQLVLQDLRGQQLSKAEVLRERLRTEAHPARQDGDSRGEVSRPAGSVSLRADVRAKVSPWMAWRWHKERRRAAKDQRPPPPAPPAPAGEAGTTDPVKVFKIDIDKSDDDRFRVI